MCLIVDRFHSEPITAESDIVCYKVLRITGDKTSLVAPIYKHQYFLGQVYSITKKKYFEHLDTEFDSFDEWHYLANVGFHSFVGISDAAQFKERLSEYNIVWNFVIAKCTIPNGSRYYKGKQQFVRNEENSPDGYCSEAIRIDEIVNENET